MIKKRLFSLILTGCMLLSLAACKTTNNTATTENTPAPTKKETPATTAPTATPEPTSAEEPAPAAKTISPLHVTIDINNLNNCTVAVSFEKGDAYVDDTGVMRLKVKVYTYDLYDMVDIALLAPGDSILLRGEEVLITSLVRTDNNAVQINGGLDVGGYELITSDNTVFFETGYSDVKTYFALGKAVLNVSNDFIFIDNKVVNTVFNKQYIAYKHRYKVI